MRQIIRRGQGMVTVRVSTVLQAEFFTACARWNVFPKGLRCRTETDFLCDLTVAEFRALRPVLRACQGRVHLLRRWGLPFAWQRLKCRWGLLLGMALLLVSVGVSSLFLWDIRITGNERLSDQEILGHLRQCGVYVGAFSPVLQPRYLKHEMLLRCEELSFITVNIWGSRANIEVRERRPVPALRGNEPPANVVAGRTGIVTRVLRDEGSIRVAAGEAVLQGELLLSGVIDAGEGGTRFVHAEGEVYAETLHPITVRIGEQVLDKRLTGRSCVRWALQLGERRINFYFDTGNPYDTCDTIKETVCLSLGEAFPLPVRLIREELRETVLSPRSLREAEAEPLLSAAAEQALETRTRDAAILSRESVITRGRGALTQETFFRVEENIARDQTLPESEKTSDGEEEENCVGGSEWIGT